MTSVAASNAEASAAGMMNVAASKPSGAAEGRGAWHMQEREQRERDEEWQGDEGGVEAEG